MSTYTGYGDSATAQAMLQQELYSLMAKERGKSVFRPADIETVHRFAHAPNIKNGIRALAKACDDRERPEGFDWALRHHIEWLMLAVLATYDLPHEVGILNVRFFDVCHDLSRITSHEPSRQLSNALRGCPLKSWQLIAQFPDVHYEESVT